MSTNRDIPLEIEGTAGPEGIRAMARMLIRLARKKLAREAAGNGKQRQNPTKTAGDGLDWTDSRDGPAGAASTDRP